jgi:hypothetical protein
MPVSKPALATEQQVAAERAKVEPDRAERATRRAAAISALTGSIVEDTAAQRVTDALCGLAGHEATIDPAERDRIASDAVSAWLRTQVEAWETQVARRVAPTPAPINL